MNRIPARKHVLTMVFTVKEMEPHVLTTPTCLNALSVPMLRQVSVKSGKACKGSQKTAPFLDPKNKLKTFRSSLAKVAPRGAQKA